MAAVEKFAEHLSAFEMAQSRCEGYETAALEQVQANRVGLREPSQGWTDERYEAGQLLRSQFGYTRAVGLRAGHQAAAMVYGLAAILEVLSRGLR
jgi:hypothetical protein